VLTNTHGHRGASTISRTRTRTRAAAWAIAGALSVAGLFAPATSAASTCPCTLFGPSDTPQFASYPDPNAVELGVAFDSDTDGFIDGVRFYKGPDNTGTHIGSLWTSDGTLLAQATFTDESATGWQQVNFSTPVPVAAGTLYVASYHTDVGEYAVTPEYFSFASVDNSPLHAPGGDQNNPNGLFAYSPVPTFPSGTFNGNNYWVDPVFTPTPLPAAITVTAPGASLPDGTTEQLDAVATFGDGTSSDITSLVTWGTDDLSIASVSQAGVLSALGVGSTNATASLYGVSGSLPLTVTPSPTVSGVSPTSGSTTGGTTVTITGTDFATGDTVNFGTGSPAASVTVNSPTSITATSPPGVAGGVDVTVTDPTSLVTSPTSPADVFTYQAPPPTVSGISPSTGPATGGTHVTITGTGFLTGSTVHFGLAAATGVTVNSPTSITASSPPGTPGSVDITVTDAGGTSGATTADRFTYAPTATAPSVTTQPTSQTASVGSTATFTAAATGAPAPTVKWQASTNGGSTWTNIAGATSATLTIPNVTFGLNGTLYRATFTNPAGSATTQAATLSVVPAVTGVLPNRGGPLSIVLVTGRGLQQAKQVLFGSAKAPVFLVITDKILLALAPVTGHGTVDVTVRSTGGVSPTSTADRFTFTTG
jgi:hypothetical protein